MLSSLKKIQDESEARRYLSAFEAHTGDLRSFARMHGIDGRSLHAWRANLSRATSSSVRVRRNNSAAADGLARSALVELVASNQADSPSNPARYALAVGGIRLEFGDDFRDSTLRRVMELLRSC